MECLAGYNMNANSGNYNYFNNSGYAKVSYDGFINENYFLIQSQEKNLVQNLYLMLLQRTQYHTKMMLLLVYY